MGKKDKVPPMRIEEEQIQMVNVPPVQIILHAANLNVGKIETPEGTIREVSLISPIGIAVSVRMNQEGTDALIKELSGGIDIARSLPPDLQ